MNLSLRRLSRNTVLVCEGLGFLALFLAPDVERFLFLAPLLLGALSWLGSVGLRDRLLLILGALFVVAGYFSAMGLPTSTLIARELIPVHALLWLGASELAFRYWRLGIALLELVFSAILSPEAHMFVLIFAFVLISLLALSLGFLERSFRARKQDSLDRPLRPSFVGSVLAISFLVFLSSLVIFPLLPRSRWSAPADTATGYNDVVSFRRGILYWAQNDSRPALWIFRGASQSWESLIPFFLLRGQVLEDFSGEEWRTLPHHPAPALAAGRAGRRVETLEMRRQPIASDALPVPYGTLAVTSPDSALSHFHEGEWFAPGSRAERIAYRVSTGDFLAGALGDEPARANLAFDAKEFPEIAALARRISGPQASDEEKIRSVQGYFRDQGFVSELAPMSAATNGQRHPVEKFLAETKRGHCELFASGTALLLRALGVPARLAVGFRIRAPSRGDALTVHSSDAHAWVEAWQRGRGWIPVDTTPPASAAGWFSDSLSEAYDLVSAYWHRYILEYEFDSARLFGWTWIAVEILAPGLFFAGLAYLLAGWWRGRRSPRAQLAWIRERFEDDMVHRAGIYPELAYREDKEAAEWMASYVRLRFGSGHPSSGELVAVKKTARAILARFVLGAGSGD